MNIHLYKSIPYKNDYNMDLNLIDHSQHKQNKPNMKFIKKSINLNLEKRFSGFMDERSPWINPTHTLVHDFMKIDGETFLELDLLWKP